MPSVNKLLRNAIAGLLVVTTGISAPASAQERMTIQATAMGTSTQTGRRFELNIHIDQFSTPEERKALVEAFAQSGQDGLVKALQKVKTKGRIRTPWGVGDEVKYIYELNPENGQRHLRLITDRRIPMAEAMNSGRSVQYSVASVELFLTSDGKGMGTLLPACSLVVDKKKQIIDIESFQNPWKLTGLSVSKD